MKLSRHDKDANPSTAIVASIILDRDNVNEKDGSHAATLLLNYAEKHISEKYHIYEFTSTLPMYETPMLNDMKQMLVKNGYKATNTYKTSYFTDTYYHKFINTASLYKVPIFYEDDMVVIRQFRPADQEACTDLFADGILGLRLPALLSALRHAHSILGYSLSFLLFMTQSTVMPYLPNFMQQCYWLLIVLPTLLSVAISFIGGWFAVTSYVEHALLDDMKDIHRYYGIEGSCFFVAVAKSTGQIVGIVALDNRSSKPPTDLEYGAELRRISSDTETYGDAFILNAGHWNRRISVSSKYRNMGIGKKLLAAWEKYSVEKKYSRMFLAHQQG